MHKTGKLLTTPRMEVIRDFSEGLAPAIVDRSGKWGYVDKSGNIVIRPQFDDAFKFSDGLARVKIKNKQSYIDKYNTSVDGLEGYIDRTGKFLIAPQFTYANDFSEGLARVRVEGKDVFIDRTGKIVLRPRTE